MTVDARLVGDIGKGLLVFVGVEKGDGAGDVSYLATKIKDLRIFDDDGDESGRKRMNRSVVDVGGAVLVVSQFTLLGDVRKGRRPAFDGAAAPEMARAQYDALVEKLSSSGVSVATGVFQAHMHVALVNDGPVTILLDSRRLF